MKKYLKLKRNYEKKNRVAELLSFMEYVSSDEILLDTDIIYEEYNDDIIISDKKGYCEDLFVDDTLYYVD